MKSNRQKIKRYNFNVRTKTRRKKQATPLRAAGVVLCSVCIVVLFAFGVLNGVRKLKYSVPGWHGNAKGRYFISSQTGEIIKGLYDIAGSLYYFNDVGYAAQSSWVTIGKYQAFADIDGKLVTGECVITSDNKVVTDGSAEGVSYYFQEANGLKYTGLVTTDGKSCYYDETGHPRSGSYTDSDGVTWNLNSDGSVQSFKAASQFVNYDDKRYYCDENGEVLKGGWYKITANVPVSETSQETRTVTTWYLFDEDGIQQTGRQQRTDENGNTTIYYYLDSGIPASGVQYMDGCDRYFLQDGSLAEGYQQLSTGEYNFKDGLSVAGKVTSGTRTYYLNGDGTKVTGWSVIDGVPTHFESNGIMSNGFMSDTPDGNWQYVKWYVFADGISKAGSYTQGTYTYVLNGCGDVISSNAPGAVTTQIDTSLSTDTTAQEQTAAETAATPEPAASSKTQNISFSTSVALDGQNIALGQSMSSLSLASAPISTDESSGKGQYENFNLYGSSSGSLYRIDLLTSAVSTAEGARVGMSKEQIAAIYSDSYETSGSAMVYRNGSARLTFTLDGAGNVSMITYRTGN